MPWITTKEYGGRSSSTQRHTRRSCSRIRPFRLALPVVKIRSSPSSRNQIGVTWGAPSARVSPTFPVRVPASTNFRHSASVIVLIPQVCPLADHVIGLATVGEVDIQTALGPAEVTLEATAEPGFLLVLTHGSNGGVQAADLLAVREVALALGGAVARVTQPFRL